MPNLRKRSLGFTIIEVLIVLAIVAFIMFIVFLVIPRSGRSSRDLQRKHAADRVAAAIEEYRSNNGHIPYTNSTWNAFEATLLQNVTDKYDITFRLANTSHDYVPPLDTIAVQLGHSCNLYGDGDSATDPIAGVDHDGAKVKYVIWLVLEAGSGQLYCIDNRGK